MRLYNDKIRLIPYEPEMWPYIYAWQLSGEYEYFFGNIPLMNSQAINLIASNKLVFIITAVGNVKDIIGMASVTNIEERHRNAHFGILVDKKYERKAIGQQAAVLLMDYMLNQMNLYKVICRTCPDNISSIKGVEKIGMIKEAELKHDAYYNGAFYDVHRYFMTKSNFNKMHKKSGKEDSAKR